MNNVALLYGAQQKNDMDFSESRPALLNPSKENYNTLTRFLKYGMQDIVVLGEIMDKSGFITTKCQGMVVGYADICCSSIFNIMCKSKASILKLYITQEAKKQNILLWQQFLNIDYTKEQPLSINNPPIIKKNNKFEVVSF